MNNLTRGLVAGFAGTLVLSVLMIAKTMMGLMPELNVIKTLSAELGQPEHPVAGWIAHFVIGTVLWGGLFSTMADCLPGGYWLRGTLFGVIGWILMMLVFFPYVGAGLFGMNLGLLVPVATLMLHVVFGLVMGATFGAVVESGPVRAI